MKMAMQKINFTKALIKDEWQDNVTLVIDESGMIVTITSNDIGPHDSTVEKINGYAMPGMINIHSHAFQRAMAGFAEHTVSGHDSFWTWRDTMYRFAHTITPDDLYHIARQLYLEMVLRGYTSVAEFHYLHHQPDGKPYDIPAEMSHVLLQAAQDCGIWITLLPVLYMSSDFGNVPLQPEQNRFGHTTEGYCDLLDRLHQRIRNQPDQNLGVAFHSLRAVPPEAFDPVIGHLNGLDPTGPIHVHIAEQIKEVEGCLHWSGKRPVEWLLDHQDINDRWCFVHATHMTEDETARLAKSGAVAGICPTTEANLGDGLFPLEKYLEQGGAIAIGSDSHISVSPIEELRLLEYGQRLNHKKRNIVTSRSQPHTGKELYQQSLRGGQTAIRNGIKSIEKGVYANLIILDPLSPIYAGTADQYILDRFVFSGNENTVKDVMTHGAWKVRDKSHPLMSEINQNFNETMIKLGCIF